MAEPQVALLPGTENYYIMLPDETTISSVEPYLITFFTLVKPMKLLLPTLGTKELLIILDPSRELPVCYRQNKLICLSTDWNHGAQAVYQLAHELCHYSIPDEVPDKLRWFEESLCELSSLFFLPRVRDVWVEMNLNYTTEKGTLYRDSFAKYAEDTSKDFTAFDVNNPEELADLEAFCEQREKNRYVANLLMPIFVELPSTWAAIPHLCEIRRLDSFLSALDEWLEISPPQARPGLLRVRGVLSH